MNSISTKWVKWENKLGEKFYTNPNTNEFLYKSRYDNTFFYTRYDESVIYHGVGQTGKEAKEKSFATTDYTHSDTPIYSELSKAIKANGYTIPHYFDNPALVREVVKGSEFLVIVNKSISVYYIITCFGVVGKMGRNPKEAEETTRRSINRVYDYPHFMRHFMMEYGAYPDCKFKPTNY